jgi:hypothetical protein
MHTKDKTDYIAITVFMRRLAPDCMGFYTSLAEHQFMLNFDRRITAVNVIQLFKYQIRQVLGLSDRAEIRIVIRDVTSWQDELGYNENGLDRLISDLMAKQTL